MLASLAPAALDVAAALVNADVALCLDRHTLSGEEYVRIQRSAIPDRLARSPLVRFSVVDAKGMAGSLFDDAAIAVFARSATLSHVKLDACMRLTDASLVAVAQCPHLTTFTCVESRRLRRPGRAVRSFTDAGVIALARARNLQMVRLVDFEALTDDGLGALKGLPLLRAISLERCPLLTDGGIAALIARPTLRRICVMSCVGLTDATALALARQDHLHTVTYGGHVVTDAGAIGLAGSATLHGVRIWQAPLLTEAASVAMEASGLHTVCLIGNAAGCRTVKRGNLAAALRDQAAHTR